MNTTQTIKRNFEAAGWGALFIWWGIAVLFPSLPKGTTVFGTGLILIAVNIARKINGIPVSGFSTTIGILAFLWGGLELVGVLVGLPFELPVFAILLIVLGVVILVPELRARQNQ